MDSRARIDFELVAARMGEAMASRRVLAQANLWARLVHQGEGVFYIERYLPIDDILRSALRVTGLYERGRRNFLDVQVTSNTVTLPGLPKAFDGFRILHLSDLHCDLDTGLTSVILERVGSLEYELAVITGDFRNSTRGDYVQSMREVVPILRNLNATAYGILGNHDAIEMVPFLESYGLKMLLNESAEIRRGKDSIWLSGIDDPHFYRTHDLSRALTDVPSDALRILLSHSPETFREAERLGFSFLLAGHTHGGQICLPGGIVVIRNGRCPGRMLAGPWVFGRLKGYTSKGTGSCGVPARFNCPPEIAVHMLRPS